MYHVYAKTKNAMIKLYGLYTGNKTELNDMIAFWNYMYPDRPIDLA
jgi:hypothetical protein